MNIAPCVWAVSFTFNTGASAIEYETEIVRTIVSPWTGFKEIDKSSAFKSTSSESRNNNNYF